MEKNKTSPMSRDMFSVTPWTDVNISRDSFKARPGTSPKPGTDFTATGRTDVDDTVATNGHHYDSLIARNVQENGYGSPSDKERSAAIYRDLRQCQFEHNIHRERPKNFETPVAVDSLPKGKVGRSESDMRHCETRKIKEPSPTGAKDFNKTENSHSEVTKIVPLKPQRSKKSLNKDNKGVANPQTQSRSDSGVFGTTGDVQMTESKGGSCEAGRRVDDYTVLQSATDVVKENTGAAKYQSEAAMSHPQQTLLHQQIKKELLGQQELRGTTGYSQWTDHFTNNSEFKEILPSGPKFPTAPPRSLPLKTQWSRDRPSDNSHIHYRTPGQETANKRKQAVNHQPPPNLFVHHRKVKHCMSFRRCRANLVFTI
uniref:uncharacterized protein n=1 Tax=Semicossyphus pulcher TaxID=241346 RepID=UPI0037E82279